MLRRIAIPVVLSILAIPLAACRTIPPEDPGDPIDWTAHRDRLAPEVQEEASSWTDLFVDDEDGAFDVSNWLASPAGFFPIGMPITEPAVGVGLGGALLFFHRREPNPDGTPNPTPPSISFAGGGATSNGTWAAAVGHRGIWDDDHTRYLGVLAAFDVNLRFYGLGGSGSANRSVRLDMSGGALIQDIKFRIGDTDLFAGLNYTFLTMDATFGTDREIPGIRKREYNSRCAGLAASLLLDTRDNLFTPTRGVNSEIEVTWNNGILGGDFDFMQYTWSNVGWVPVHDQLVLGLRLDAAYADDGGPFYKLPFIQLRGVPVARDMGNAVVTAEIEPRYCLTERWALVGFAGAAKAAKSLGDLPGEKLILTWGGGIRYRIARKLGIWFGVDFARGPESNAIYIVFGNAWLR